MYARYLAFLLPLLILSQTAEAQRRTGEKTRPISKVTEKSVDAETLIRTYRFDEAISSLQQQIATAKRQKKTTIQLEQALSRARLGAVMLSATEKVRIIDSLVVDRGSIPIPQLRKGLGKLQAAQTLAAALGLAGKRVGEAAYINDWGDRAYFAMADTTENLRLYAANRFVQKWGQPSPLPGFTPQERNEDFPFMDPDGVTLYFAADGAESLGGYDLFQTRYDADAKAFLKPQNLGMPFNSPANDFLMVINRSISCVFTLSFLTITARFTMLRRLKILCANWLCCCRCSCRRSRRKSAGNWLLIMRKATKKISVRLQIAYLLSMITRSTTRWMSFAILKLARLQKNGGMQRNVYKLSANNSMNFGAFMQSKKRAARRFSA